MKRFRFTFQTLHGVKKQLEKQALGELALIEKRRQECLRARSGLIEVLNEQTAAYGEAMRKGIEVSEMRGFAAFFEYLNGEIEKLDHALAEIEAEKKKCQEKLIVLMKEIKALDNLRDAQFARYLKEVQKEEELEMSDFVNYQIIAS